MTPAIIEHLSPNHSPRKKGVRVDTIVLHHTGPGTDASHLSWLCSPESGVSAHYLVGVHGDVWRLVPEALKAWHAGESAMPWEWPGKPKDWKGTDVNQRSIGVELVNPGDGVTPFTEEQYLALAWLVPDIISRIHYPGRPVFVRPTTHTPTATPQVYILGHRDVAPGRKNDPDPKTFDWGRVRAALASQPLAVT